MQTIVRRVVTAVAAAGAAVVARRAAEYGWKVVRGEDPPTRRTDADDDTQLRDLMLWSAVVTIAVLLARKLAASKTEELLTDGPGAG